MHLGDIIWGNGVNFCWRHLRGMGWVFGGRFSWNEDVDTLQVQGIICGSVTLRMGFHIVEFAVPKCATDG